MENSTKRARYRFGAFEAEASTGELRRQGLKIKLGGQPFQVLLMLLEKHGELVTREEIQQALWADGTFVDFDHGLNSAINRIREALGDSAANPRFLETLARRGYRFLAPVERIEATATEPEPKLEAHTQTTEASSESAEDRSAFPNVLTSAEELPKAPHTLVRILLILMQVMYLSFYVGMLANLGEVQELLAALLPHSHAYLIMIVSAAISIPIRLFLISAVSFRAPGLRGKYLWLFPLLLVLDELWALSPFLLLHHINAGVALAATAALVYSPFAQRSLMLMSESE